MPKRKRMVPTVFTVGCRVAWASNPAETGEVIEVGYSGKYPNVKVRWDDGVIGIHDDLSIIRLDGPKATR